jgi:hypothetical protein
VPTHADVETETYGESGRLIDSFWANLTTFSQGIRLKRAKFVELCYKKGLPLCAAATGAMKNEQITMNRAMFLISDHPDIKVMFGTTKLNMPHLDDVQIARLERY